MALGTGGRGGGQGNRPPPSKDTVGIRLKGLSLIVPCACMASKNYYLSHNFTHHMCPGTDLWKPLYLEKCQIVVWLRHKTPIWWLIRWLSFLVNKDCKILIQTCVAVSIAARLTVGSTPT